MLRFTFPANLVPPDRLRYRCPDGYEVAASDRPTWYAQIRKHYRDNSIPIPDNIEQIAQDQWCRTAPPGFCAHEDGVQYVGVNIRLELADYLHGMRVLSEIATSSEPLVSQSLAEERAAKCAACPVNVAVPGCAPCVGISNLIVGVKGASTTKADHVLKTCAICKCSCAAMVWVKTDILAKGVDATQMAQMANMPDCWKVREISELAQNQD